MKWDKVLSIISAGFGACINYLWGGLDVMFVALLSFMTLDFITGIICGGKRKELDSEKAYVGITKKKMMILIMVAVAVVIDRMLNAPGTTRSMVIFYYFAMEGISIMENAAKLDFPFPEQLKDILFQLKENKEGK
ncbi:phage holin family protein [Clostridium sp. D2Q-14]|uniref:phage holin family protein n=1 Tax=Anaeromonas gelatinilytica TaxID=2683194 RepID=UPI00193BBC78|nr:phage holin family protein [Anaeromonas gelatinilytica]MBS4536799.1 phage holin family protein [Anaeromonas gelatinilytica]